MSSGLAKIFLSFRKLNWMHFTFNKCHYYWQSHGKIQRSFRSTVEKGVCMCMTMAKDSLTNQKENRLLDEHSAVMWQSTGVPIKTNQLI